jgi:hypothetical protein
MKRKAMEKVDDHLCNTQNPAIWENNEEMILQLSGLKSCKHYPKTFSS